MNNTSTVDGLLAWIAQNPLLAGLLIFAVAFGDALVLIGIAIPSLPLLFGVGTLVGLGLLDPWYAMACAALGAFLGDGLSYLIGRVHGQRIKTVWPFSRYPQWLMHGETFFRRHGLKGILIARYVGAVRPFVPVIAGILHMRASRYLLASALAAVSWAFLFMAPGWVFGASLDLLARIAGRLAIVAGVFGMVIGLIGLGMFAGYRVLAPRAALMIERALGWSHRHPVLGRVSIALIDPRRPESASLALLALGLVFTGWAFFTLLIAVVGGEPLRLDLTVHQGMFALRNPLADAPMAVLASLGDWQVLLPAIAAVFAWLWWRRRRFAAGHWIAAPVFGLVLVAALGWLLEVPRPPAAMMAPGFSFPSAPVAMATVVFGFFAVLVARELPGRRRAWPYVAAALVVGLIGFSRLYLGAHWLSDVISGVMLGAAFTTALGLAYRRRIVRSFWARPLSLLFFGTFMLAAGWHGPGSIEATLSRFEPPIGTGTMALADWWRDGWQRLPERRNELRGRRAWPLNVEYAGELDDLRERLHAQGWATHPQAGWIDLLQLLAADATPDTQPLLPAAHRGRAEALLMSRADASPHARIVLRLWASPYRLTPDDVPLWIGTVQRVRFTQQFDLLSYWEVERGSEDAPREALRDALADLPRREAARTDGDIVVLRLRSAKASGPD